MCIIYYYIRTYNGVYNIILKYVYCIFNKYVYTTIAVKSIWIFSKTLYELYNIMYVRSTRVYEYIYIIHTTQQCSVTFSIKRFLFGSDDANRPADCPGAVIGFNAVVQYVFVVRAAYDTYTQI